MSVGAVGKRVSREADRDWVAAREQEAEAAKETAPIDNETSVPEGCPSDDDSNNIPFAAGRKDTVSRDLGGANAPRDDESVKENQRAAHCGPIARTNRVALK
jgi:hypothetical protein